MSLQNEFRTVKKLLNCKAITICYVTHYRYSTFFKSKFITDQSLNTEENGFF
jgi:hypothetical protein